MTTREKMLYDICDSLVNELNNAGFFFDGENDVFRYDPSAKVDKPSRDDGNAVGPTLVEVVDELASLRTALAEANDLIKRIWELSDNETSTIEIKTDSNMWQIEADTRAWLAAHPAHTEGER